MNPPRVAIIADDLTGALDVCAPFARRGLRCRIAVTPHGMDDALATSPDIVCVNTASRELEGEVAKNRVDQVARQLAQTRPSIVFNKIDSRLKGHIAAGIESCMAAFGRAGALLAPAVPAQSRFVEHGHIVGQGVSTPIDIAGRLGCPPHLVIGDGATDADMERLARQHMNERLLVGASGLGVGLAQALTDRSPAPLLHATRPLLIAIGSHDPATLAQVQRLDQIPGLARHETGDGRIETTLDQIGVALARAISTPDNPDHGTILARFGSAVADQLRAGRFASVLLCGGETAQTVLDALGIASLDLLGEALSGIPVSRAQLAGHALTVLTKSGGFGTADDLFHIAEAARTANRRFCAMETSA